MTAGLLRSRCRRRGDYFFAPIAETLIDERTNMVPFDSAGVAISSSPIELVAGA